MWIPTPVYERIPQFYFLIGLLLIANGLYLGFEFVLSFYYIGFGLAASAYGVAIFLMRMQNRQGNSSTEEPSATAPDHQERQEPF